MLFSPSTPVNMMCFYLYTNHQLQNPLHKELQRKSGDEVMGNKRNE